MKSGKRDAGGILNNVIEAIGETPLIRLNRIPQKYGIECEMLVKCEFLNPGGSVKDRIGARMITEAQKSGRISKEATTLVEPTSGNTGVGLALAAAVEGYKLKIFLPDKMSQEKVVTMATLGAEIIRTPNVPFDDPQSNIQRAYTLAKSNPSTYCVLDQYNNQDNPLAHYYGTGAEILRQCDGQLDMFVAGTGTGGTMSGTAKKLKEALPNVRVVAADPVGSLLADPENPPPQSFKYEVEGIGYDFIPGTCDRSLVDQWVKTDDATAFTLARMLHREEGLLVGGSSGSALQAALEAAKSLKKGQRCVVLMPDSIRNYMTKFVDDGWMKEKGFLQGPAERPTYDTLLAERDALRKQCEELKATLKKAHLQNGVSL